jgi:hypothetical protein
VANNRTNRTPKKGKPQKRTSPDWGPRFLISLAESANIYAACKAAKVSRSTVYLRRDNDVMFAAAMAAAIDDACDDLELEARRRAKEGVVRPVFQGGARVGEVQDYSDTLLIFLLKAHRPEKFRDNVKVEHAGKIDLEIDSLTDAELNRRIEETEAKIAALEGTATSPPDAAG